MRDVEEWPGHIACDGNSRSEVVVPIFGSSSRRGRSGEAGNRESSDGEAGGSGVETGKEVVGVIDVDCAEVGGFDEVDRLWLERLAELLGESCDW